MLMFIKGFILFFVYIFAMRVAANYSDADDASYLKCIILAVVLVVVHLLVVFLVPYNPLLSSIISTIVGGIICIKVLKIPGSNFIMFIVMFIFLRVLLTGLSTLVINGITQA